MDVDEEECIRASICEEELHDMALRRPPPLYRALLRRGRACRGPWRVALGAEPPTRGPESFPFIFHRFSSIFVDFSRVSSISLHFQRTFKDFPRSFRAL